MESRDGWRRGCWRVVGVADFSEYLAGKSFAQGIKTDSYASGLIAELVLLLAKLMYEKAVRYIGTARGRLLCKSTCHLEVNFEPS